MFPVRSWKLTPKMLQRTLYLPRKSSQAWEIASKIVAIPWLQKTSQRLRGSMDFLSMEMVKPRTISFRNPYLRSADHSAVRWNFSYTFSNLAGHGSFLLLALSYLEKDFLHLRLFAASGMSLSIIFQYYREKPLWIPIRWNILFLLINTSMVAALLMERAEADHMSPDEKVLYTTFFERRGKKMNPTQTLPSEYFNLKAEVYCCVHLSTCCLLKALRNLYLSIGALTIMEIS